MFSKLITLGKNKVHESDKSGVVCKIDCNECGFPCISQTSFKFRERIIEYQYSVTNELTNSPSAKNCSNPHDIADYDTVKI